jgi:hypothetical protein
MRKGEIVFEICKEVQNRTSLLDKENLNEKFRNSNSLTRIDKICIFNDF